MKFYLKYTIAASLFAIVTVNSSCTDKNNSCEALLKEKNEQLSVLNDSINNLLVHHNKYKNYYDSTHNHLVDTTPIMLPEYIVGRWNARLIVTKSDCKDIVIGDVLQEVWEIPTDSVVNTINTYQINNTFIRPYSFSYADSMLSLIYQSSNPESLNQNIKIVINEYNIGRMKGIRTNQRLGCAVTYAVELTKNNNQ